MNWCGSHSSSILLFRSCSQNKCYLVQISIESMSRM
jgi:hypothetical protein